MFRSIFAFCFVAVVLTPTWALQVTPNSPCASVCMDDPTQDPSDPNLSNTSGSDIVCLDGDYTNTTVGQKFETCLNCLQNSTASSSGENDQAWFLYNLRYAFNTCVFGTANATDPISTPCSIDTVCGPLEGALTYGMPNMSDVAEYSYCSAHDNSFLGSYLQPCEQCLRENDEVFYFSNFLVALNAGCVQQPQAGVLIGLNGSVFSDNQVAITSPITAPAASSTNNKHKGLTTGAIIGIAVAGGALCLMLIAVMFVCVRKHRNNNRLKQLRSPLDSRFGAKNISAPNRGAFNSPKSSPPLKQNSVQMKTVPKPSHLNLSRQASRTSSARSGEWYDYSGDQTPSIGVSPAPPVYSPPNSGKPLLPTHHAYIPPDYSPPLRNSTSPMWVPPPQPPAVPSQSPPASLQQLPMHPTRSSPYESIPTRSPPVRTGSAMSNTTRSPPVRSGSAMSNTTRSPPVRTGSAMSSNARSQPTRSVSTRSPPVAMSNTTRSPPVGSSSGRSPPVVSINTRSPPVPTPPSRTATPATAASYINRSASNASRNHNRDLSFARERAGTPVNQISGPIIQVGNRFEDDEDARRARERLYRDGLPGLGGTMVHNENSKEIDERTSPESSTSEEQWPGNY